MYICYKINTWMVMIVVVLVTVAEPDLQMKGGGGGGGGGHPDPEIRRAVSKKIISAFRASVWSKDKGGGGRPPWPLPWIRHWVMIIMY